MNRVFLLGNLGAAPELKYLPSGQPVCEMRMATTERYKDRNEQQQEKTEWHRVVAWGKLGENCGKFLAKGSKVLVEGKLQTRSWDNAEGKKQYMTEIVARSVQFLSVKGGADGQGQGHGQGAPQSGGYGGAPPPPAPDHADFSGEDDIPF